MFETISNVLFVVSTAALAPVVLALLALATWTLLLLGGFVREWRGRGRDARRLVALRDGDAAEAARRLGGQLGGQASASFVARYLRDCWSGALTNLAAGKRVDELELEMHQATANLSAVARLGPMLGLAGTLIPLGPGLVSLAQGDVAGLASQLVIAFSTTIVGLLVGVISFACAHVRRGWYARDLAEILYLEELRGASTEAST